MWRITAPINGNEILEQPNANAREGDLVIGPQGQQSPPVFDSFAAWARSKPSSSRTTPPPDPIVVSWPYHLRPVTGGPNVTEIYLPATDLTLGSVTILRDASLSPLLLLLTILGRLAVQMFFS